MTDIARRGTVVALLALSFVAVSRQAECVQQPPAGRGQALRQAVQAPPAAAPVVPVVARADAEETRVAFRSVLDRYSPTIGRVLALDPMLLQNASYLEPYPELVAFLQQHPEVARNGAYYLQGLTPSYYEPQSRESQAIRMWQSLFQGIAIFLVFGVVTSAFVWLVKTLVDYRRWYRLSKVQTEAHNKLLDRFTASDELLAYISTPSGKRFLESAPIMLDISSASIGAPVKRILWAVEIGVVMVCVGVGIFFAQTSGVQADVKQALFAVSIVVTSLGIGFVLAAVASYLLSRRMGVLGTAATRPSGGADVQPGA
jgi:hypothetical protein